MKTTYQFVWSNGPRVRRIGVDIREFNLLKIRNIRCLIEHLLGYYKDTE